MVKKGSKLIIVLIIVAFIITSLYIVYQNKTNNEVMLIMYTDINYVTHYISYDLKNQTRKELFNHVNTGFPTGSLSKDKKYLYYTYRTPEPLYHLYKLDIKSDEKIGNEIIIPDFDMDLLEVSDDRIYMRGVQLDDPYRRNFNIAVYDLQSGKINIWNKEEKDLSINDFDYNPDTQKLYVVEKSLTEFTSTRWPNMPTYKIVEFDKDGNRLRELFEMNMFIYNISVSKDGDKGLFLGATYPKSKTPRPPVPRIYIVDFKTSKVETILESDKNFYLKDPIFAPDEKGFYFLAITPESRYVTDDSGEGLWTRGVYYYDFETKEMTKIFMKDDGVVRNININ